MPAAAAIATWSASITAARGITPREMYTVKAGRCRSHQIRVSLWCMGDPVSRMGSWPEYSQGRSHG